MIWTCFQNNGGLISFSVEEAEEEEEKEEVKANKEKTSGNILVVETDFERMPRRSSFRSKERRELTRYLPPVYQTSNWKMLSYLASKKDKYVALEQQCKHNRF